MTYATEQDLIDRFGETELIELTDRTDSGAIDSTVVAKALADADGFIDSYVGQRYDLPLAATPGRLVKLAGDIARYYLHDEAPTDQVRKAYEDAHAFLRDVSMGRAILQGAAGAEPEGAGDTVQISAPDRAFTNDSLKGL